MALAKYKYAAQTVLEGDGIALMSGASWNLSVDLDGSLGIIFHVALSYESGNGTLAVQVLQGICAQQPPESAETPAMSFEMAGSEAQSYATIPVLLPDVGPYAVLQLTNSTGGNAYITVHSRRIEGVEVA